MLRKVGGPTHQGGRETDSWHQTVEEDRRSQDAGRHEGRARHNIKPALCIICILCVTIRYIPDNCNRELCLTVPICFRRINHMAVKNHLHSSSGVQEVVAGTIIFW
jgi:hypothetical protein